MAAGRTVAQDAAKTPEPAWTLVADLNDVKVWSSEQSCGDAHVTFLKVENSGLQKVSLSYKAVSGVIQIGLPENGKFSIQLGAGEIRQGACNSMSDPALMFVPVPGQTVEFQFEVSTVNNKP